MRLLAVGLLGLWACGGGGRTLAVTPDDVPNSSSSPSISGIVDLGDYRIGHSGEVRVSGADGVAVIGELILVEGDGFGRLPTIKVAGRAGTVLARTAGGGILLRVPIGVPTGKQDVEVRNSNGRSKKAITLRRLALVLQPDADRAHVLEVEGTHARLAGAALPIANPRLCRYSTDGSIAYVAGGKPGGARGALTLVRMAAKGGPQILSEIPVPSRTVVALATADEAPLLAVIGEGKLTLFQIDDPERPNPFQSMNLPDDVAHAGVLAADLSPDGKLLALMLGGGNRVMLVNVADPARPAALTTLELLPDERVPLLRDLQFSIDGHTLWVVAGDGAESLRSGQHPARLITVRLGGASGGPVTSAADVAVWKTAVVPGADSPLHLAVAKGQMLASGTTIRVPPENAAVFFTAIRHTMFALEAAGVDAGKLLRTEHDAGQLLRSGLDSGGPMSGTDGLLSSLDVSADAQVVLASEARVTAGGFELAVAAFPIFGQNGPPTVIPLGKLSADLVRPPFAIGAVRIQP